MNPSPLWQRPVFIYVGMVSLGLLLTRFFHFVLLDWLTLFLLPLEWLLLAALALGGMVWGIWFWVRSPSSEPSARDQRRWRSIPLAMQLGMILMAVCVPLENLWLFFNFHRYLPARQQVITLIQANEIPSSPGITPLPSPYRSTSMGGGEVQIIQGDSNLSVMFFTMRIFDAAAGYVYSEDGSRLPIDAFGGYDIFEQRPVGDRWYFVRIRG